MPKQYKSNNNVVYSCNYHVLWCPKYNIRKVLTGNLETRLKELIREACRNMDLEIIEMEVMADHVHLAMEVNHKFGVYKTPPSRKPRLKASGDEGWQRL
ncbi:MAG: IS200/IS605 family transposase [Moorea sp. SIO3I7]|nr:IS200/IS605 family transposase [Moorena sp. SIO3I7]NEO09741.1 IS200/IS605 family transposase [Moorena sp. SIO3I8]